jgi:hypothetical protein
MALFTTDQLGALLGRHREPCVSIYMPTQPGGPETLQNAIRFKNQLRKAERMLEDLGQAEKDSDAMWDPARRLLDDHFS